MTKPYLRDLQAEAVELLKERGEWIVAGVKTNVAWPLHPQVVPFGGLDFILRPQTKEHSPTVCLNASKAGFSAKDGRDFILKFGSALAFAESAGFEVHTWIGGSSAAFIGQGRGSVVQEYFHPEFLPDIPNEDASTAMALYREGLTSENNFYAFLSLYKVISFIHRDGKKRGEWIQETLPILTDKHAKDRLAELQKDGINATEYLRDFGRHAIAHAEKDAFVNPDKLVDHERIYRDLSIMRALARCAIKEQFQLYPRLSLDAPKKSEIPGFERIFGPQLIEMLLKPGHVDDTTLYLPDNIMALIRHNNKHLSISGLYIDSIKRWEDGSAFTLVTQDQSMFIAIGIDFRNKTLVYEPQGNCGVRLNAASRSSIHLFHKLQEFNWLYYGNGRLELWDAESDELLGMTGEYHLWNAFLAPETMEKERARIQQLLDSATED